MIITVLVKLLLPYTPFRRWSKHRASIEQTSS